MLVVHNSFLVRTLKRFAWTNCLSRIAFQIQREVNLSHTAPNPIPPANPFLYIEPSLNSLEGFFCLMLSRQADFPFSTCHFVIANYAICNG